MRCYHPFWNEHSKENFECEASAYNRYLAFNPLPVRGGEEIRRPCLHPPSSNFGATSRHGDQENYETHFAPESAPDILRGCGVNPVVLPLRICNWGPGRVLWQFMLTLAHFIAIGTPPSGGSRVQTNASAA
jgi:hypothetical protein